MSAGHPLPNTSNHGKTHPIFLGQFRILSSVVSVFLFLFYCQNSAAINRDTSESVPVMLCNGFQEMRGNIDVFPSSASNDFPDRERIRSEMFRDLLNRMSVINVLEHLQDIFLFKPATFFSVSKSPLVHRISDIVFCGPEKQMIRPNTWRVIAFVANLHIGWNFAVLENPRCPSRITTYLFSINDHQKRSIPVSAESASPNPARIGFSNVLPKPILRRDHFLFQYGLLHLGQTPGTMGFRGTHWCPHLMHLREGNLITFFMADSITIIGLEGKR